MIARVSDEAVQAAVLPTLRAVHDADGGSWAHSTIAQLAGLLHHVAHRPLPAAGRVDDLVGALAELGANPLVPPDGPPYGRASAALAGAVGRDDVDARAVRAVLRPLLVTELDDELASTAGLIDAFRGRMPDA